MPSLAKVLGGGIWSVCLLMWAIMPNAAQAHRSGCHNLHTCPSDSNTYVCGDLGYPCNGATKIDDILPSLINVPLLVESTFREIFGRKPTIAESDYWKKRFRGDKESIYQIRRSMAWHQVNGSFGPPIKPVDLAVELAKSVNAIFRSVYDGRNPTVSENHYWIKRIQDKPTLQALKDTMAWHKANNISH